MNADIAAQSAAELDAVDVPCLEYQGLQPVVRIREEHNISRRDIDPDALKVLYRLARNDYIAYLVGGGVRDLLLGRKPKDFDVSTNAKPEQIRSLFRNCILIGRRFRLAHIRYGDKIIETSTFRSTPKCIADPSDPDADLFQRDDNLFGSPQEDALRRDFTVNGLFYDIESFSIIDYVGGMEDLAAKRIRCIGDPCIRFREDPVRMVRAVRFASRLNFTLDAGTEDAIRKHGDELAKAAPARLLEEITRLFAFASGERAIRLMHATGLLRVILPEVADCLDSDKIDSDLFWRRLQALDRGDTVLPDATPALIFSVLLTDALKLNLERDWTFDESPRLRFDKVHAFLDPLALRLRFPRKLTDRIVHMFITQHRFAHPGNRGKRGSLANFVTQDAFHESLALAEIVLTSEGGQQTRLNHWRDLLAERIYGRDDVSHAAERRPPPAAPSESANGERPAVAAVEDDVPGKKLSRSARRRRNKRLRRQDTPGEDGRQSPPQAAAEAVAPIEVEPVTKVEDEAEPARQKPSRSRNDRRSRGRRNGNGAETAPAEPIIESNEPVRPLTAAAFWTAPEPDPKPEPEPEPETGKKKNARKPRGEAKAKAKKEAEPSADAGERKPLPMDRADEADIPMHWLDEI